MCFGPLARVACGVCACECLCRARKGPLARFLSLARSPQRNRRKRAGKGLYAPGNAMREFRAFLGAKKPMFIVNAWKSRMMRENHAFSENHVNDKHWRFGVLARWQGPCFVGLVLWIARVCLWPGSRPVRVCALCAFWSPLAPCETVCVLDSLALGRVSLCVFSLWRVSQAHRLLCLLACVSKNEQRIVQVCFRSACEVLR